MVDYEFALKKAWEKLQIWVSDGRLTPDNEEEILCFLYYCLVDGVGSALYVKPKSICDKPEKLRFADGRLEVGRMHFPDLVLGPNRDIVLEIKFARSNTGKRGSTFGNCKNDIQQMLEYHKRARRYFILFEQGTDTIFLDQYQYDELQAIDPECEILWYPSRLTNNPGKANARRAIETMRKKGIDFQELGRQNAQKAIKGH